MLDNGNRGICMEKVILNLQMEERMKDNLREIEGMEQAFTNGPMVASLKVILLMISSMGMGKQVMEKVSFWRGIGRTASEPNNGMSEFGTAVHQDLACMYWYMEVIQVRCLLEIIDLQCWFQFEMAEPISCQ